MKIFIILDMKKNSFYQYWPLKEYWPGNRPTLIKTGIFRKYPSQTWYIFVYLFNYTEYYLEHWLNKQYPLFVVFRT
jgi:hypothetical protein